MISFLLCLAILIVGYFVYLLCASTTVLTMS